MIHLRRRSRLRFVHVERRGTIIVASGLAALRFATRIICVEPSEWF